MERLIRNAIVEHIESNKLISSSQHGFVRKKSCVTNLLETIDFLTKAKSQKQWVDMVMLDFAKAFDKVPHRRLLLKLQAYGIGGNLLLWIENFLTERKQRVILGNSCSAWVEVTSGVPQGSVLGPILFVLFINDLPDCVSKETVCKLFADDSKLITVIKDEADRARFQSDLLRVGEWTRTWLMELNIKKCKYMHFSQSRNTRPSHYFMEDHDFSGSISRIRLEQSFSERDLGIQIRSDMNLNEQCD